LKLLMNDKKILIVDDEPDVVSYLTVVLKNAGYETSSANKVEEALELVEQIEPDLICLDIMMPRESGISMYTKLKQDKARRDIPVLIISGAMPENEFDFRSLIDDDSIPPPAAYLEKPIVVERFLDVVENILGSKRPHDSGKKSHG